MVQCSGVLAVLLGIVGLFIGWERPVPLVWWCLLGVMIGSGVIGKTFEESSRMYGLNDSSTVFWAHVLVLANLSVAGLAIFIFVT
jgi:hypothetical protein